MLTIKFISTFFLGPDESCQTTVSCARYDVDQTARDRAIVTVYKDYSGPGVQFELISQDTASREGQMPPGPVPRFEMAYVENETGKTIDKIGPLFPAIAHGDSVAA